MKDRKKDLPFVFYYCKQKQVKSAKFPRNIHTGMRFFQFSKARFLFQCQYCKRKQIVLISERNLINNTLSVIHLKVQFLFCILIMSEFCTDFSDFLKMSSSIEWVDFKGRSPVWKHYQRAKDDFHQARCKICDKTMIANTQSLRYHAEKIHLLTFEGPQKDFNPTVFCHEI